MTADSFTSLELRIISMWESGRDTYDIAKSPGMPSFITEAHVYRMLPSIREKRRRGLERESER